MRRCWVRSDWAGGHTVGTARRLDVRRRLNGQWQLGSLFARLRIIPSGWSTPISLDSPAAPTGTDIANTIFTPLDTNPYLPFWHVWKPSRSFSKKVWDGGSARGLAELPPDFWVAVVEWVAAPALRRHAADER